MPLVRRDSTETTGPTENFGTSLERLQNIDPVIRLTAARELCNDVCNVSYLLQALRDERERNVIEAIFNGLIRLPSPDTASGMLELLNMEDATLRNGAIDCLKKMPKFFLPLVDVALEGTIDLRIFIADILSGCPTDDALPFLMRMLEHDADVNVCGAALEALMLCGDSRIIPSLNRLCQRFEHQPFLESSAKALLARVSHE